MRVRRFVGVSFGECGEMLREGWREFFALLMYFKAFAPAWPPRAKLFRTGKQMLLLVPAALIFLSSFAQAGSDQQISFRVVALALIFSACIAVSWFVAGVILGGIPPLLRIGRLVGLASFFACGAIAASAQTQPNLENGFKNYDSIHGSNIDSVSLMSGNWMLHASALPDVAQRGDLGAHYFMYASSKNWQIRCISNPTTGQTCYWTQGGTGVFLQRSNGISVHRTVDISGSGTGTVTYEGYGYTLNTAEGGSHQLYGIPGTADANGDATVYESLDTTGYHLALSNQDSNGIWATATVIDRQGNQYVGNFGAYQNCPKASSNNPPSPGNVKPVIDDAPLGDRYCSQTAFMSLITDANGNQMTYFTPQNQVAGQDTVGRSQPLESGTPTGDYSGCVSRFTVSYAFINYYTGPGGATQQVKTCYAAVPFQTAFNATANGVSVMEAQNVSSNYNSSLGGYYVLQLVTVILADGSKWTYDYDSYLEVTTVGLPTGGSINLTWTTINFANCNPPDPTYLSRAVASRTLNDNNGHSSTWNYSWGTPSNGSLVNTVTDALGNDTVHSFTALSNEGSQGGCGFYETRTQDYQGTGGSRQLLKQVDTTYSSLLFSVVTTAVAAVGNVVPTSIQTTVYPSGKVSLVTKSYDTGLGTNAPIFGNVMTEKDYDWGQGSPGPLLRETDTTYQWQVNSAYLAAHMLDLPASVVVKDSNGNRMAETDYTYDESVYLASSGITTQHGAAPASLRGNLTTVSRWLNTSTSPVVSHTNWYDTGEAYQAIDPLGHTTTHSYSSAFAGAYPTQSCNPLNQCVGGNYDFTTGLLTSFTDANGNTSNYSYDLMARLTSAQAPPDPAGNRPQTSFTYSAPNVFPLNVQRTHTITASLNDVATNYFDGLGRLYRAQHATPQGNSTIDTTYDGLDHEVQVTNPYYSTSDPTYGVIQTQYDALGRPTQTTKQDGSVSTVAYDYVPIQSASGDCTKTTDEAGKQRLTCADSLNRLIEVHEPGDNFNGSQAQGSFNLGGSGIQTYTIPGTNATYATGSVTINGIEQSKISSTRVCAQYSSRGSCLDWEIDSSTTYDSGSVKVTVNGISYQYNYGVGGTVDNVSTIANNLQTTINNNSPYVQVTSVSSNLFASPPTATLYLQARNSGTAGNYSLSASTTYDTADFSAASFATSTSGLGGGTNGTSPTTVYDSGTVTVTIGSFTASAPFSQGGNTTAAQVAQALVSSSNPNNLNRSGSPVTASVSGSTLAINYATVGTAGNVSLGCKSSTSQGAYFSSPSFTCPATTALSGGYNPEGASLDFNYFVTQYSYDALGNMLSATQKGDSAVTGSSLWRVRTFSYDSLSRLLTATNPESGAINYTYDANGNLLQKTSPAPNQTGTATQTVSFCYDALNRVTGKAYSTQSCPLSSPVVTYTYDAGANGIGHLTSLSDQAGTGSYIFDALGRITTEQRTIAGIQKSLAYAYNLGGSVATLTYPSGAVVTYTPDSAGRTLSAIDSGSNIRYVTGATYGPDSGLTGFVSGASGSFAGITNSFSYNKRLQPVTMSATAPSATVFSIDYDFHLGNGDNGNVFGITNYRDSSRNQTFAYDSLNRLISAQNSGTDCTQKTVNGLTEYWGNSYGYEAWGNLLQKTVTKCGAENLSITALANNQLSGYGYDAAGNMTHDATTGANYSYDQESRITGAAGYIYSYDADGNRVEKSNGSTGTIYWYMAPGIVAESDLSGNLQSEYVFFGGERAARKDFPGGAVLYYFSDYLRTAAVITDSAGNIKSDSDFYPWGGELQFLNDDSNHYKFTGKERDAETGLDYFGKRYYGYSFGRWTTPDAPFADQHPENPQSWNLYMYAANRPTSLIDTDGREVKEKVTYKTYDVHGQTAAEANANALTVSTIREGGETFMGETHPTISIINKTFSENEQGYEGVAVSDTLTLKSADVQLNQTVTLPNWVDADQASAEDQAAWKTEMDSLKDHENGHVEIDREEAQRLDKSLPGTKALGNGSTGAQAQAAANKKLGAAIQKKADNTKQQLIQRNADYDQQTDHGRHQENWKKKDSN